MVKKRVKLYIMPRLQKWHKPQIKEYQKKRKMGQKGPSQNTLIYTLTKIHKALLRD